MKHAAKQNARQPFYRTHISLLSNTPPTTLPNQTQPDHTQLLKRLDSLQTQLSQQQQDWAAYLRTLQTNTPKPTHTQLTCYACGRPGHFRRNCPHNQRGRAPPRPQYNNTYYPQYHNYQPQYQPPPLFPGTPPSRPYPSNQPQPRIPTHQIQPLLPTPPTHEHLNY